MRRLWPGVAVGSLALLVAGCAGSRPVPPGYAFSLPAAPRSDPSSPRGVLASILAPAAAQKSVHYSEATALDLLGGMGEVDDVTSDSAKARRWSYDGSRSEIRLVAGTVYLKANRVALAGWVSKAKAKQYAGRWISIPRGDRLYGDLASGLSLASIVRGLSTIRDPLPQRKLEVLRKTSHGRRILVVQTKGQWGPGWSRLTARAGRERLPIALSQFVGYGNGCEARFSKWNEPVSVHAPAKSTSIATVRG